HFHLNDFNPDLIYCHEMVKKHPKEYIAKAKRYFKDTYNSENRYYQCRKQFNESKDPALRSALFLYLNRHGFNGLCRYNASGEYNVPFGRYVKPYFSDKEIMFFNEKSKTAKFYQMDFAQFFEKMLKKLPPKDCVFY